MTNLRDDRILMKVTLCKLNRLYASYLLGVLEQERMSDKPENRLGDTVRLLRPPPRVTTDECGRNIWMGDVEVLDLELAPAANCDPYNSAG